MNLRISLLTISLVVKENVWMPISFDSSSLKMLKKSLKPVFPLISLCMKSPPIISLVSSPILVVKVVSSFFVKF